MTLNVTKRGDAGDVVVLVHGVGMPGRMAFYPQNPLAAKYRLWIVDRRGYGESPPVNRREDFEVDAADLLQIVPDGAHLVGVSYGTLGSIIAAGREPERFASLTLVECPAFSMAPGDPAATQTMAQLDAMYADASTPDRDWFERYVKIIGAPGGFPDPLPPPFDTTVAILRRHRRSWDQDLPLDAIAAARLPTLVVSSGEHDGFEAVSDHLAAVLDARHERIGGHGHLVPLAASRFNALLDEFFSAVQQGVRT